MVAIRGPGWGLAPCLVDLIAECDELAPNRSTISDGSMRYSRVEPPDLFGGQVWTALGFRDCVAVSRAGADPREA